MGRYSDIRRGEELKKSLDELRKWEDLSRAEKQALYKAQRGNAVKLKPVYSKGYVESFTFNQRTYLPVRLLADEGQTLEANLIATVRTAAAADGRTLAPTFTTPSGAVLLDGISGFKPARLSITQRGNEITDKNTSRVTKSQYKRYSNRSVSSPFGSNSAGSESYEDAVKAIKAQTAIVKFAKETGNRVSFTPEIV
ncbi:MAG: hypothetical protein QNJ47_28140 [Nostocaceae cyanobacterium]|nr:hypothetical protein [Nostocaceae cyanobacterium]